MLRLISTMLALLALLCVGALWVAAQPSGSELRAVVAPILSRGLELAGEAGERIALTRTASGIWEPESWEPESWEPEAEPEVVPARPPAKPTPIARQSKPERRRPARPEPVRTEPEEILLEPRGSFVESSLPELPPETALARAGGPGIASEADGAPRDQEGWAALIRRMLVVHRRVSGSE